MPTLTLHYKEDPSAGPIPAEIHYSSTTAAPKPIILIFHAGGFAAGSTALIPPTQIKYLTETLDTIIVAPAYRLCPQVSLREGPLADARDCLAWARTELASALRRETAGEVVADAERIGVMGHSAGGMLALELGNEPHPPAAILDFYGIKYLADPFWTTPLAAFAGVPDAPAALRKQVFDGSVVPVASPPMFVDGRPDLRSPRSAWMIHALKHGTWFRACVEGGDAGGEEDESAVGGLISEETLAALEPTRGFGAAGARFPPTCFVHGTEDVFAPFALAERAEREARAKGVKEVEFVRVPGAGHVFDIGLAEDDELFKGPVVTALKWFVERIRRSQG